MKAPLLIAAGRVEVDSVEPGEVELGRIRVHDRGIHPGREVVCRDCRGDFVPVHSGDREVEGSQGEGIRADTAAQVGNPVQAGRLESTGVQGRDAQPGGLFEPGLGEQHPLGERSELGGCPRPKLGLAEHGCDQPGGVAILAQLAHQFDDVGLRLVRWQ